MGEDGARGKDWLRARGHHLCLIAPVSYRHNFLVSFVSWYYVYQARNKMKNDLAFRIHLSASASFLILPDKVNKQDTRYP